MPGKIWQTHETEIQQNITQNGLFCRKDLAVKSGLKTVVGIPVLYSEEFLGCIMCLSPLEKKELVTQVKLLCELAPQLAAVMKQKKT